MLPRTLPAPNEPSILMVYEILRCYPFVSKTNISIRVVKQFHISMPTTSPCLDDSKPKSTFIGSKVPFITPVSYPKVILLT